MTRAPCGVEEKEVGLKKGPWTPDEDQKLVAYIQKHGHGSWRSLPVNAGLQRCGKSCRLRWTNYLRPDIKRGRFSQEEDQMIVHLHAILGNRWSAIASHLPRRTDNEIKNYWNTHLKKRLLQMGIDPVTHKSTASEELVLDSIIPGLRPVVSSNLTHMSQWDCARAEAEARLSLSRQSSLSSASSEFHGSPPMTANHFVKTPTQGASTNFMSTWKAQVAETLRPSFGVVELDKTPTNPVNLQTFLQDWETSLQGPQGSNMKQFPTYDSPIDVPDLSSGTTSEAVSPQISHLAGPSGTTILPTSSQITERLLASRCEFFPPPRNSSTDPLFSLSRIDSDSQGSSFNFSGMCNDGKSIHRSFSPTSTLHAPDYDSSYTNSPCVSSNNIGTESSTFDLLTAQSSVPLMFPGQEPAASFWCRQQVAMVDALQGEQPYYNVGSVAVPNNIPIPQFDSFC
ncbi:hypothetical protein M758_9G157300 [Ceratodon purpureus]|nr:hypothetical protein M758_9G157300 [Ceratodon purpureus]